MDQVKRFFKRAGVMCCETNNYNTLFSGAFHAAGLGIFSIGNQPSRPLDCIEPQDRGHEERGPLLLLPERPREPAYGR